MKLRSLSGSCACNTSAGLSKVWPARSNSTVPPCSICWKTDRNVLFDPSFPSGSCIYIPGPRGNQKFLVDQKFLVFPEKPKKKVEKPKIFWNLSDASFLQWFFGVLWKSMLFSVSRIKFYEIRCFFGFPYFSLGMFFCFNIVFGFTLFLVSFFFGCVFFWFWWSFGSDVFWFRCFWWIPVKCTCPMYIYTNVFVTYIYAEGSFFSRNQVWIFYHWGLHDFFPLHYI